MESSRPSVMRLEPALYRICILGHLDANWSEHCGGMAIKHAHDANSYVITILTGRLLDQSALMGVLNSLHDLGYLLISVEYIAAE